MNRKVLVCVVFSTLFLFAGTWLTYCEAAEDSIRVNETEADSSDIDAGTGAANVDNAQTNSEGEVPEAAQSEPVGYYDADGDLYSTETDDSGSGSTSSSDVSPDTVNINDVPEDAVVQSPSPEDTDSSEDSAEE